MVSFIVDTLDTNRYIMDDFDVGIITANGTLYSIAGVPLIRVVAGVDQQVIVDGAMLSASGAAISTSAGAHLQVFVTSNGRIVSDASAISGSADLLTIINNGTIEGIGGPISYSHPDGGDFSLNNAGTILSNTGGGFVAGMILQGVVDARINNSGEILSSGGIRADGTLAGSNIEFRNSGLVDTGSSAYSGGAGRDRIFNTGDMNGSIFLGEGTDSYDGRFGQVTGQVAGGIGDDTLRGGAEANELEGGEDNDLIYGFGGDDTIRGGTGFDTLNGNGGDDLMDGGGRSDLMNGGRGNDTMTGAGGGDTFVMQRSANGDDVVTDFQNGLDVVDLSSLGILNFNRLANVFNALSQEADGVLIDLSAAGGSGSVRLDGVVVADMDASDFIF